MPNIIFKVKNYKNNDAVENLVNYITTSPYYDTCGWNGCFLYPGQNIAEGISNSFHAVKNVYYKNNGKMVQHIIIGFSETDCITGPEVSSIAGLISLKFFLRGYQNFWGIHFGSDSNESYWHIHIAVNSVNMMNGCKYVPSYEEQKDLRQFLEMYYPDMRWGSMETESFYHENVIC